MSSAATASFAIAAEEACPRPLDEFISVPGVVNEVPTRFIMANQTPHLPSDEDVDLLGTVIPAYDEVFADQEKLLPWNLDLTTPFGRALAGAYAGYMSEPHVEYAVVEHDTSFFVGRLAKFFSKKPQYFVRRGVERFKNRAIVDGTLIPHLYENVLLHFHPINSGSVPSGADLTCVYGWTGDIKRYQGHKIICLLKDGTYEVSSFWSLFGEKYNRVHPGIVFLSRWNPDGERVLKFSGLYIPVAKNEWIWVRMNGFYNGLKEMLGADNKYGAGKTTDMVLDRANRTVTFVSKEDRKMVHTIYPELIFPGLKLELGK